MCIAERLKEVLTEKKIKSIKEFADACELPYRTAQSYLNGAREPNIVGLTKLCTQLGININWLLTGVGSRFLTEDSVPPTKPLSHDQQELVAAFDKMTREQQRSFLDVGKVFTQPKPGKLAG
ncbi:TPA: helix-turn-helix domain-containing protein [Escherichia coli]